MTVSHLGVLEKEPAAQLPCSRDPPAESESEAIQPLQRRSPHSQACQCIA